MGIFSKKDKFAPKLEDKAEKPVVVEAKEEKKSAKSKKEAKSEAKVAARGPLAKEGAGTAYRVLAYPIFTEKSALLQSKNQYVFAVARGTSKVEVASAVRDLYGVKPESVRIIVTKGKKVRFGRYSGKEKDVKKAIVTLKKGDAISIME